MKIYVRLHDEEAEALDKLAKARRRHPSDQAAILIRHALEHVGVLPIGTGSEAEPDGLRQTAAVREGDVKTGGSAP